MEEVLQQERYSCQEVYATESWVPPTDNNAEITWVTEKELGRLSQLTTPNQVLAVVDIPETSAELPPEMNEGWSMFLDGIQSPANLGALLRIADWFGFQHVIGGPGTADLYNAKSIQASMGSFLRIDYREGELQDIMDTFPDLVTFGADLQGEGIYGLAPPEKGVLVIGAEGPGLSAGARSQVQRWVTIPRAPGRRAESLNAAVAAGILAGSLINR